MFGCYFNINLMTEIKTKDVFTYKFDEFWNSIYAMTDKVKKEYNLSNLDDDCDYYVGKNGWYIKMQECSHPQFDETILWFEIWKNNVEVKTTTKFMYKHFWHHKSHELKLSTYELTENLEQFVNKIYTNLVNNIDGIFKGGDQT